MFPKNSWEDPDPLGLDVPEADDRERCTHGALEGDCDTCAEAAHEDSLSAFYGNSSPQTDAERSDAAWQQKRGLR